MIWNKEDEQMSREELNELQVERLQATVRKVYNNVPFYKNKLNSAGVNPNELDSLKDLSRLPFTTKDDLRDNYPFGLFTVPLEEVVRIHSSSGTTGKPTVVGYTQEDIEIWTELMARTMSCGGIGKGDIVQNAFGYGLFTGGLGIHYGAEKTGASVVPISGGNTKRQIKIMEDFGSTALMCTPSYALYIAEIADELGFDIKNSNLKYGIFGAEPWSDNMRKEIEKLLGIKAIDIYGLSEIIGPGVASECQAQDGLHIFEDHFIPEVIDPKTGEVLDYGQKGELVFTTITKNALPVIRYRTKDISVLHKERCSCGRTLVRMERISGRVDDMLIIRGVNVFPSQIESVLLDISETKPHYQLVVERKGRLDTLEVWVEVSDTFFSDEVRRLEELERKIHNEIESVLGISVKVKLVEQNTIPRSEGKAKRVVDKRKL
ncbi:MULTISPECIES: phenylacetate--CoA ligase family protein [unclassified Candidatus Frackibacter]|uniref:phenylacetate--CoA ligase family protein n=1 Tax=unclassified Candidatus Frackibacter TaxID=2648818 RepID=UPI00087EDA1E|nr:MULTISPECIES: phenylacetate--CoA ligase [unclassified Candidatus Frackibacter]SDC04087.1 phenylacetate-CoA ligase [Candidatus Frackibacter sp. WG11]SEM68375.1 phenylacetate-CoA ligase [Candidatus Frackibacter sp. WG12]SFL79658.1 phenylacetate-CoA ligase [Candidatus Frackibacter sp. WG13]